MPQMASCGGRNRRRVLGAPESPDGKSEATELRIDRLGVHRAEVQHGPKTHQDPNARVRAKVSEWLEVLTGRC